MAIVNISNSTNGPAIKPGKDSQSYSEPHLILQVMFSVIAALAIFGNGLLCVVILRDRRRFLRSSYNLVILSLAVIDTLTGVFIASTPGYIIGLDSYPVPHGVGGELFCRLISTQYFVFVFGKVSVLTIVALALDRWYAIVKPIAYKLKFTRKRVYIYIAIIWLLSCMFNGSKPLKAKLDQSSLRCSWTGISYPKNVLIPAYTTVTFFIPIAITWVSFLHVSSALKKSLARRNEKFRNTRKKLTRMCAIVAFLLSVCWLPNQVFYTLSAFDITKAETPVHHFTIVCAMFNSCVNPWVYCFTNRQYMAGFKRLFCFASFTSNSRQEHYFTAGFESGVTDGVLVNFHYINSVLTCDTTDLGQSDLSSVK